ncbi:MAG: hypothetical protein ABIJ53_07080 [Verrucomicrobiota bacterium]
MRALHQNIKKPRAPHDGRAGSALVAVLGVSLILMLAGVTMVVLSRQSMHRIQRTVHYAQAQAVAEAGIADMTAKLGTDYTAWQNTNYTAPFFTNGAYYVVTTQPQTNGNVLITSDGIYMGVSNRTIMELLGTVEDYNNLLYNTNAAIMSGGPFTLSSGAATLHGDVAANGSVTYGGGASSNQIDGYVSNNIIPPLVLPTFNFDSYRQMATNGGTYYPTNVTLSGTPIASPTNGILYVNGDLTIKHNSSFIGTIVVNGDIDINNNFTQTNAPSCYDPVSSNMPSLLSTGNITLGNNGTYYGVMYGTVKFEANNNITIYGGVINLGVTEIKNKITIYPSGGYPVWDPKNPYETPSAPIPGGWLK